MLQVPIQGRDNSKSSSTNSSGTTPKKGEHLLNSKSVIQHDSKHAFYTASGKRKVKQEASIPTPVGETELEEMSIDLSFSRPFLTRCATMMGRTLLEAVAKSPADKRKKLLVFFSNIPPPLMGGERSVASMKYPEELRVTRSYGSLIHRMMTGGAIPETVFNTAKAKRNVEHCLDIIMPVMHAIMLKLDEIIKRPGNSSLSGMHPMIMLKTEWDTARGRHFMMLQTEWFAFAQVHWEKHEKEVLEKLKEVPQGEDYVQFTAKKEVEVIHQRLVATFQGELNNEKPLYLRPSEGTGTARGIPDLASSFVVAGNEVQASKDKKKGIVVKPMKVQAVSDTNSSSVLTGKYAALAPPPTSTINMSRDQLRRAAKYSGRPDAPEQYKDTKVPRFFNFAPIPKAKRPAPETAPVIAGPPPVSFFPRGPPAGVSAKKPREHEAGQADMEICDQENPPVMEQRRMFGDPSSALLRPYQQAPPPPPPPPVPQMGMTEDQLREEQIVREYERLMREKTQRNRQFGDPSVALANAPSGQGLAPPPSGMAPPPPPPDFRRQEDLMRKFGDSTLSNQGAVSMDMRGQENMMKRFQDKVDVSLSGGRRTRPSRFSDANEQTTNAPNTASFSSGNYGGPARGRSATTRWNPTGDGQDMCGGNIGGVQQGGGFTEQWTPGADGYSARGGNIPDAMQRPYSSTGQWTSTEQGNWNSNGDGYSSRGNVPEDMQKPYTEYGEWNGSRDGHSLRSNVPDALQKPYKEFDQYEYDRSRAGYISRGGNIPQAMQKPYTEYGQYDRSQDGYQSRGNVPEAMQRPYSGSGQWEEDDATRRASERAHMAVEPLDDFGADGQVSAPPLPLSEIRRELQVWVDTISHHLLDPSWTGPTMQVLQSREFKAASAPGELLYSQASDLLRELKIMWQNVLQTGHVEPLPQSTNDVRAEDTEMIMANGVRVRLLDDYEIRDIRIGRSYVSRDVSGEWLFGTVSDVDRKAEAVAFDFGSTIIVRQFTDLYTTSR